jgi:Flp pilus assembly pilin Flp
MTIISRPPVSNRPLGPRSSKGVDSGRHKSPGPMAFPLRGDSGVGYLCRYHLISCTDRSLPSEEGVFIMLNEIRTDIASEAGQTMAEYAVVLGVITIAVVVTLGLLSTAIANLLKNVISVL